MPLKVKCRCGTVLTVPTQRIGKSVRCPACSETVVITPPKKTSQSQTQRQSVPRPEAPAGRPAAKSSEQTKRADESEHTPKASDTETKGKVQPLTPRTTLTDKASAALSRDEQVAKESAEERTGEPLGDNAEKQPAKTKTSEQGKAPPLSEEKTEQEESPSTCEAVDDQQTLTPPEPTPSRKSRSESPEPTTLDPESLKVKGSDKTEKMRASTKPEKHLAAGEADKGSEISEPAKPSESKPGIVAKKLPPALKRAGPASQETARGKAESPSRPKKPPTTAKEDQASGLKVGAVNPPPPLKPKPAIGTAESQAQNTCSAEIKGEPPPLRKQPAGLPEQSEPREKGAWHQPKSRRGKKQPSRKATAKSAEGLPMRGVEYDLAKRWSAYYLAIGVIFVAVFNMAPAFYEGFQAFRLDPPRPLYRWAYAALILGLVQLAYAFYLIQLPDWGSVWVVAILSLLATTMYAALVSAVILGSQDSNLLESLQLNYVARKKAVLWCTSMLSLSAMLTYLAGRLGIRWHKAFSIAFPTKTNSSSS